MSGTWTVAGLSASEPLGERVFGPLSIVGQMVIGETLVLPLSQGDNVISVPSGSVAVMIVGPTNGSATLVMRTSANQSDVGLPINGTGYPLVYPFPSAATPTTLTVTASAGSSAPINVAFI